MNNLGIQFEIPNEYGNYLADILEPLSFDECKWLIENDEIYLLENNKFTNQSLFNEYRIITGEKLYSLSKNNTYYMIFISIYAFFADGNIQSIRTYKEFLSSDCQIVIAVSDCSYVFLWCKNAQLVTEVYRYAISKNYMNVEYISEDDLLEEKYYIE